MFRRFMKFLLLPVIFSATALQAAKISSIKFEQEGDNPIPEELLSVVLRLRPGMEFSAAHMDADLKSLFDTGKISDAVAEFRELPDGTVEVVFKIKPSPVISMFKLEGNKKFSTRDLQECLEIADGDRLSSKALSKSVENLRKYYIDRGYTDVQIGLPAILPDGNGGVIVTVTIEENLRLKVNDVTFEGVTAFSESELRSVMYNRYSYWNLLPFINDFLNHGLLDRQELETDCARLRELYYNKGYLDFKVADIKITPTADDPEFVDLHFIIEEGEPYVVEKVSIEGNSQVATEIIAPLIRLTAGETFSQAAETATIQAISAIYDAEGYSDLTVRPVRTADYPNHRVSVVFQITEGRKYFVRDIVIVGNTSTREKVLRRELAIQPGDPVTQRRIQISRQRLMGMGYFTSVEAEAVNADALNEKDIRITVEENPARYNFRIGAGASDVSSFFGMAEISTNNFDITNPRNWFYGGGQRLRIQGIYGVDDAGFNIDFIEPWLFDLPLRYELSAFLTTSEYDDWDETRIGVRTSLQRKIFDDFTRIALGYKFETVRVHNIAHSLKRYFKENHLDGTSRVSQFSLNLTRDTRDSVVDPTEGYYINLFGSITPEVLGSSSNYYRLEARGSYHYSFFDKAIVVSLAGKIGVVSGFDYQNDVPVFERYFLGGSGSVRGFEHRSIGKVVNDRTIGGQTMMVLSAEISHPIWGPLRGAAFIDAGDAWSNAYSMDWDTINVGVGYGLRLKLPMIQAPLQLDVAYPVVRGQDNLKRKFRIHFNVGFSF